MGGIPLPLSMLRAIGAGGGTLSAPIRAHATACATALVTQAFDPSAPWWHEHLRAALERAGVSSARAPANHVGGLWRAAAKAGIARNVSRGSVAVLGITGNRGWSRWLPWGIRNEIVPYAFDCWEPWWDHWERALRRFRVRVAMFSSHQAAAEMARRIPELRAHWIPEALDPTGYAGDRPLVERTVDVLEFGRRHATFGRHATRVLASLNARHVYPEPNARLVPDHDGRGVRDALSNARALVCFPRCDTHPEKAGRVETVTARYFEGIFSGCVLVGRAPQELIDLFGYNPVVTVDPANPGEVLRRIVEEPGAFQELVTRNLIRARRVGTWDTRAQQVIRCLESEGYAPLRADPAPSRIEPPRDLHDAHAA